MEVLETSTDVLKGGFSLSLSGGRESTIATNSVPGCAGYNKNCVACSGRPTALGNQE
ncbi:MAG: hypothetical protein LBJ63_01910 [Prevotellaceae bacterium]|nr:hypothetical protein [Prevotellaceae bacterium]